MPRTTRDLLAWRSVTIEACAMAYPETDKETSAQNRMPTELMIHLYGELAVSSVLLPPRSLPADAAEHSNAPPSFAPV